MTTISTQTTVGELVAQRPARSRVFEKLGIDYCCGGRKPLAEVCEKKGLDPQTVLTMLEAIDAAGDGEEVDAANMGLAELCDHIVATHHAYLREELPRLDFMTHKVSSVHGDREPRLHELRDAFVAFQEEVTSHLMKEEQILFPIIKQLELGDAGAAGHCGSIANPIAQMEHEHDNAGVGLETMRRVTDDFTPPEWACNTFRALYDALAQLEPDMHRHIHKENNVLFPRAQELEQQQTAAAG
ncbi:MAG: iron-sulfur cluster repair di-iron protein [Phycisphaeraceae bacterium]